MTLKERLEHIFSNDYPGTDVFLSEVIKPIFGDEIEPVNIDLAEVPQYAERARKAGLKHIKYIGDLTDQNYNADNIVLLDVTVNDSVNIERSRVNIQQLVRSIVQQYQHMLIVFHYENTIGTSWRFSYAYKAGSIADMTSAKRYTYVFGKGYRGRTAAERFEILANSERTNEDFEDAFSVQALSDDFFNYYRAYYAVFVQYITGVPYSDEKEITNIIKRFNWLEQDNTNQFASTFESDGRATRDYVKKMFGRIVFLYFLQRKGWLYNNEHVSDPHYMHNLFSNAGKYQDSFLDDVLETLFFYVLNTKEIQERQQEAASSGRDISLLPGWQFIPYLNGGLFSQDDIDPKVCHFPASYFRELFSFLDSFNFTIDENDSEDAEIGIDPEMLGRIFENLLEDNKDKGAYYTPKPIVDYMCQEAIIAYLQDERYSSAGNELIRQYVITRNVDLLNETQRKEIEERLLRVKICDPAIGSGAFPMGIVNILSKLFISLRTYSFIDQAKMKRYIMQQSIYGVDIEQGAVDIARLRFWLAMVVDEDEPMPLPNLHFKIMQGNSLLESYNNRDLTHICGGVDEKGQSALDFSDIRTLLRDDIKRYFNATNHEIRDRLLVNVKNLVINQIYEETKDPDFLKEIRDVTANTRFFLWHTWFVDVFEKGGFDIVIGNPPYIKEGRGDHGIFEPVKQSPYYLGKMDIWYMFACRGIDMLKPGGNLCFIATNNWTTSAGAKKLRNKIINETQIIQLCDFRDYMIFDSASIQTMVMQFKKNHTIDDYSFDLRVLLGDTLDDVTKMLAKDTDANAMYLAPNIRRNEYRNKFLTFSDADEFLTKLNTIKDTFKFDNSEIAQGIVFPQDFLNKKGQKALGHHKIGDGIFGLKKFELDGLNLTEEELTLIKPYYTSEEVKRYITFPRTNELWLIYTDSSYKNPNSLDPYPHIKAHLDQFVDIFTSDNRPYGLHRARDNRFFGGEKIICQRKCVGKPIFSYSDSDCYLTQTFNIIKTERVNSKYLTALLNSKLVEFWLRNKGKMQGLNFQLDKEPLQQIPIKLAPLNVQEQLSDILENIISAIAVHQNADIKEYEDQIDHIVYHLYDLTYDEVLIVDPETPITREEYENFSLE